MNSARDIAATIPYTAPGESPEEDTMKPQATNRSSAYPVRSYWRFYVAACLLTALGATPARAEDTGGVKSIQIPGVAVASESAADGVVFAGQPTKETLEAAAKKGIKVVINLRRPEEMTKLTLDEKTTAESLGMKYLNVPMSTSLPKDDALKSVLDLLADGKNNPVLLHCASSNRAGAIWALYSGTRKGESADAAIADGKAAGMTNEALEHIVRNRLAATEKK